MIVLGGEEMGQDNCQLLDQVDRICGNGQPKRIQTQTFDHSYNREKGFCFIEMLLNSFIR
ncbi:hypothetical protein ABLO26_25605 [Neobacillus sp. 179-J 1A1 HS]|uniref:hypothetical protein n=1 Tax=Neobacillus driksii TaxID=3035913 RepID=UPI0035BC1423